MSGTHIAALISGPRTFLRHPVAADQSAWIALRTSSQAFLQRWEPTPPRDQPWCGPPAFKRYLTDCNSPTRQRFLVCRRPDGAIMGHVGLSEITRGSLQSAYMGYWIGQAYSGQAYMTEAITLALKHAFSILRLHRVEANIQPNNAPSLALARRVGFKQEGFSPRYLKIAGRWCDHERWAITTEAWKPIRPRAARPGRSRAARA